jgi:tmRNA-binding protein
LSVEARQIMTRQHLEQYRSLGKEIAILEQQLQHAQSVADTVRASSKEEPYLEHSVMITGIDAHAKVRLDRKRRSALLERLEIERYIDRIADSQLRVVMDLRYLKGMRWSKIANNMGNNTADSVRMMVSRHFNKR